MSAFICLRRHTQTHAGTHAQRSTPNHRNPFRGLPQSEALKPIYPWYPPPFIRKIIMSSQLQVRRPLSLFVHGTLSWCGGLQPHQHAQNKIPPDPALTPPQAKPHPSGGYWVDLRLPQQQMAGCELNYCATTQRMDAAHFHIFCCSVSLALEKKTRLFPAQSHIVLLFGNAFFSVHPTTTFDGLG